MSHVGLVGIWQRATGVACLSFLWLSYVSGRAWEGIPAAAASCQDLEALLHDPTVTRISIIGVIVVRDCTWRNVPIPGREITVSGWDHATIDFRGMHETIHLGVGVQLLFSDITLVSDVVRRESFAWILHKGDDVNVGMKSSVLRFSHCMEHMANHPWLMGIWGSSKAEENDNICSRENGRIMMNEVDIPASGGITVQIRKTEVACDDFGAEALQHLKFKLCKRGAENRKVLSSSTKLKLYGVLCIIVAITFLLLFFSWRFLWWKKNGSTMTEDKLLPRAQAISPPQIDHDFVTLEDVQLCTVIGKGGFSTVYQATLKGEQVAVKMFENRNPNTGEKKEPSEELVSSTIIHPNVVRCIAHRTCDWGKFPSGFGASYSDHEEDSLSSDVSDAFDFVEMTAVSPGTNWTRTWLVMEYCNMGSIFTAVKDGFFHADRERGLPNLQRIVPAAIDVARALEHLHAVGVIHGDLKSQNVLLQASDSDERGYVCKVCDFGFSRLAINRTHIQTFTCGSVRAMPPEVLKDGFLTPAADVYSFGILLWELLRGRPPYQGWRHQTIMHNVVRGRRPRVLDEWPRALATLVRDCLRQSHNTRPNFTTVIARLVDIDLEQSVCAYDEPDCPINLELDDPFFTCSCCAEDDDSLKLPKTLGIEPSDLSRFTIGADSSKSLNQYTGESQEIDGGNLWMGMNWY